MAGWEAVQDEIEFNSVQLDHIVPVARLEAFRALQLSRLKSFRAQKSIGQIGGVQGPKTLQIGEF